MIAQHKTSHSQKNPKPFLWSHSKINQKPFFWASLSFILMPLVQVQRYQFHHSFRQYCSFIALWHDFLGGKSRKEKFPTHSCLVVSARLNLLNGNSFKFFSLTLFSFKPSQNSCYCCAGTSYIKVWDLKKIQGKMSRSSTNPILEYSCTSSSYSEVGIQAFPFLWKDFQCI